LAVKAQEGYTPLLAKVIHIPFAQAAKLSTVQSTAARAAEARMSEHKQGCVLVVSEGDHE